MSLHDQVKEHYKKYGSGNFYKFLDGGNQVRILVEPKRYDTLFKDKPTDKFIAYGIVRDPVDGDIPTILNLPMSTISKLEELEFAGKITTESYPLQFDVMIMKETSKSDKVTYMTMILDEDQSMNLTAGQIEAVKKMKPIEEVAEALQRKSLENVKKALPSAPALAPTEVVDRSLQIKQAHSEVNSMFIALQSGIENAKEINELDQAVDMIKNCTITGSINEFEAEMLKSQLLAKKKRLVMQSEGFEAKPVENLNDVKVEDIPF